MRDPRSALARLRSKRHRRRRRRRVTRTETRVLVIPRVRTVPVSRAQRIRSGFWTLYSRWEWRAARARTERARRAARSYRR
ncbi:MAG TPA: hypothetical protein VIL71_19750 [Spirillospora sp.]